MRNFFYKYYYLIKSIIKKGLINLWLFLYPFIYKLPLFVILFLGTKLLGIMPPNTEFLKYIFYKYIFYFFIVIYNKMINTVRNSSKYIVFIKRCKNTSFYKNLRNLLYRMKFYFRNPIPYNYRHMTCVIDLGIKNKAYNHKEDKIANDLLANYNKILDELKLLKEIIRDNDTYNNKLNMEYYEKIGEGLAAKHKYEEHTKNI
jgi:hypothetical protein